MAEKICIKCGHAACPHCGDWCDVILYSPSDKGNHCFEPGEEITEDDYPRACCDMECTYENPNSGNYILNNTKI